MQELAAEKAISVSKPEPPPPQPEAVSPVKDSSYQRFQMNQRTLEQQNEHDRKIQNQNDIKVFIRQVNRKI